MDPSLIEDNGGLGVGSSSHHSHCGVQRKRIYPTKISPFSPNILLSFCHHHLLRTALQIIIIITKLNSPIASQNPQKRGILVGSSAHLAISFFQARQGTP